MSRLYATINESARKTMPTARAHHAVAASVKNWSFTAEARIDRSDSDIEGEDTLTITLKDLRTGQTVEIVADEIESVFKAAKKRNERAARAEAAARELLSSDPALLKAALA
jgi:hypothetical protein